MEQGQYELHCPRDRIDQPQHRTQSQRMLFYSSHRHMFLKHEPTSNDNSIPKINETNKYIVMNKTKVTCKSGKVDEYFKQQQPITSAAKRRKLHGSDSMILSAKELLESRDPTVAVGVKLFATMHVNIAGSSCCRWKSRRTELLRTRHHNVLVGIYQHLQ